jgi:hypothetical protein
MVGEARVCNKRRRNATNLPKEGVCVCVCV